MTKIVPTVLTGIVLAMTTLVAPVPAQPTRKSESCRVAWRSKTTGATGHGQFLPRKTAEAWLEYAKGKYSNNLERWLECK